MSRYNVLSENDKNKIRTQDYSVIPPLTNSPWISAPQGKRWQLDTDFSDEFQGSRLDEAKWIINNPTWNGRLPSWFKRGNVFMHGVDRRGGRALYLHSREDEPPQHLRRHGHHTFSTAFVRTRKTRLYGYFEIVCRLMDSEVSSAFWFSNPTRQLWTELDVFEYSTSTKRKTGPKKDKPFSHQFATNYFVHRHPDPNIPTDIKGARRYDIGFDLSSQRVKVGFNWQKDYIEWYLNDVLIRREENKYFHQPLHLQFDSETFPNWFGLPTAGNNSLPNSFRVMYVRSWYLKNR